MASTLREHGRVFTFDAATMGDEVIAPDDEMQGMTINIPRHRTRPSPSEPQKQQQQKGKQQRSRSNKNDDENRTPPPAMETVVPSGITNSSSNHPHFDAWKRDMTENLLSGTKPTSPSRKKIVQTDWKTTRLNKRRLEKKLLHQQLRSTKSDSSTKSESESSDEYTADDDQRSSIESSESSSRPVKHPNKSKGERNSRQPRAGHFIHTVYIRKDPVPPPSVPMSPRSQALERPTMSAVETPVSPRPNSRELADIQNELADLKCWAEEGCCKSPISITKTRLRQSTPPSSPKSPSPPASRLPPPSPERKERQRSKGSQDFSDVPRSIVVPQLVPAPALNGKKYKKLIEQKINGKGMGIPAVLTIKTTITATTPTPKDAQKTKTAKAKKKKKKVRFNKPLITDTIYRPKTPREEIDTLYFQEEELIDWEIDEETTAPDRFEVVITDFGSYESTYSGTLSIGTPEIFFHDSFSSFISSDDEVDYD